MRTQKVFEVSGSVATFVYIGTYYIIIMNCISMKYFEVEFYNSIWNMFIKIDDIVTVKV